MFFIELLATPQEERAEKVMYCSQGFWKKMHSGALTGRLPGIFELDQFRVDCLELNRCLLKLAKVASRAPQPYSAEVNRWLYNFSPHS